MHVKLTFGRFWPSKRHGSFPFVMVAAVWPLNRVLAIMHFLGWAHDFTCFLVAAGGGGGSIYSHSEVIWDWFEVVDVAGKVCMFWWLIPEFLRLRDPVMRHIWSICILRGCSSATSAAIRGHELYSLLWDRFSADTTNVGVLIHNWNLF